MPEREKNPGEWLAYTLWMELAPKTQALVWLAFYWVAIIVLWES